MSADAGASVPSELPTPRVRRRRWAPALVWLIPLTAVAIGASLVVGAWRTTGPRVTIRFQTAEGLEANKTLVKYRDVTIGHVTRISLSADHDHVQVTADLVRSATDVLTADARFWVVRPRIGLGGASGLDTLFSGAYIAVESGEAKRTGREFIGLENPPPLMHGLRGKSVVLHAEDVGSLIQGAPVYYRRFEVGHVIERGIEAGGSGVRLVVFIDAPYDRYITRATRFWNASGINVTLGADGFKLRTQSLASVLAGGVAFDTAPLSHDQGPVSSGTEFTLFEDHAAAMAPPDGEPDYVRMRFSDSLRGLSLGAPIDFLGINIGRVFSIDLDYDPATQSFPVIVTALIYPRRMGKAYTELEREGTAKSEDKMARLVGKLVARGLRAQPRTGNLLTGQLYIALDFIPRAPVAKFLVDARPLEIPTIPGSVQELQQKVVSIVDKIDRLPMAALSRHLDEDFVGLSGALGDLRAGALPAGTEALHDLQRTLTAVDHVLADGAPWRDNVDQTLVEARRTLRSVRSLADYLDRHPEALLRGRQRTQPSMSSEQTTAAREAE
jgi:paraquat-inducible protein B